MLTEVRRLEVVSSVAHMEGSKPNRLELPHMLYATFLDEINNVVDIQFIGNGCYHLEFSDLSPVAYLLKIKHTTMQGNWISFYKCTHNVVANDILQNKEAHMIYTTVFWGLKKEFCQLLSQIGSLLGTIIAIKNEASQEDDRIQGATSARILAPKNSVLPSSVFLLNLQEN